MDDDQDEDDIYCNECGEEDRISYVETNAECDVWKCRTCGNEFQTSKYDEEES